MPFMDGEREVLTEGAVIAAFSSAALLVLGVIWGFPWQALLLFFAVSVVIIGLITASSLADARRDAQRRAESSQALITWAGRNGGRYGTALAAFTNEEGWELPASPLFRGQLLAVGRQDCVEVGIACSTEDVGEVTAWHTVVLVRLPAERLPIRLRGREVHQLGLPRGVESVEMDGRQLCVRYVGWPEGSLALNERVDAAVRLGASLPDA
ncbi:MULTISPECIES: hypothetical protein [Streptomyces]|uniref:Uncharacterized protein n=2 Tax=Streptomyces TaxID=1883 RepID=A0ABV9IIP4_9ACTN